MESVNNINSSNWTHCYYFIENDQLKISINLVMEPQGTEVIEKYCLSITDSMRNDLYETYFNDLDEACRVINDRYSFLPLIDLKSGSKGGCDSCEAH